MPWSPVGRQRVYLLQEFLCLGDLLWFDVAVGEKADGLVVLRVAIQSINCFRAQGNQVPARQEKPGELEAYLDVILVQFASPLEVADLLPYLALVFINHGEALYRHDIAGIQLSDVQILDLRL